MSSPSGGYRPSIPRPPTILVSHFPLIREPLQILTYPVFAQWCGTGRTVDWHLRFRALATVYWHLHIPGTAARSTTPPVADTPA